MSNATIRTDVTLAAEKVSCLCVGPWHIGCPRGKPEKYQPILFLCVSTPCAYRCNVWESLSRLKFAETVIHLCAYSSVPLSLVECHCKAWEWLEILTVFVFLFTCVYTRSCVCTHVCVGGVEDLRCRSDTVHPLFVCFLSSQCWGYKHVTLCLAFFFFLRWVPGTEMESPWSQCKHVPNWHMPSALTIHLNKENQPSIRPTRYFLKIIWWLKKNNYM